MARAPACDFEIKQKAVKPSFKIQKHSRGVLFVRFAEIACVIKPR